MPSPPFPARTPALLGPNRLRMTWWAFPQGCSDKGFLERCKPSSRWMPSSPSHTQPNPKGTTSATVWKEPDQDLLVMLVSVWYSVQDTTGDRAGHWYLPYDSSLVLLLLMLLSWLWFIPNHLATWRIVVCANELAISVFDVRLLTLATSRQTNTQCHPRF